MTASTALPLGDAPLFCESRREGSEVRGCVRGPSRVAEVGQNLVRGSSSPTEGALAFEAAVVHASVGKKALVTKTDSLKRKSQRVRFGNDRSVRGLIETEVRSEDNATVPPLDPPKQVGAVKAFDSLVSTAQAGATPAADRNVGARL